MILKPVSIRIGAGAILVVILVTSFGIPQKARAQTPVIDAANLKVNVANGITLTAIAASNASIATAYQARKGPLGSGVGLDSIAWLVAKMAIQMMLKSVVNWINSGFQGSPAFITDLPGYLQAVGDVAAGAFLNQLASNASIQSPFQSAVATAVATAYYVSTSPNGFFIANPYTLNQITPNDTAFLSGDFSQGGWTAWFAAITNPQNNPYGAQILAEQGLMKVVGQAQAVNLTQAGWGQGFLSWCSGGSGHSDTNTQQSDKDTQSTDSGKDTQATPLTTTGQAQANTCANGGTIQTPGSVIQAQVNKTLGLTGDELVTADEFNEVVGALISQLMSQVLGATGLTGIASASSGGSGYIDQATDPSALTEATASSTDNGTFINAVDSESQAISQFQTDWQTIGSEAALAEQAIGSCTASIPNADVSKVQDTVTRASTADATATAALSTLQQITTDATNAVLASAGGSDTSVDLSTAMQEFQDFMAASSTPSTSDINFADKQAQDNSDDVAKNNATPTLYTKMEQIAAECPAS